MAAVYLSRVPVLNRENKLVAYDLRLRAADGGQAANEDIRPGDDLLAKALDRSEFHRISGPFPLFMPVTADFLLSDAARQLAPGEVVPTLDAEELGRGGVREALSAWRNRGGRVAVDLEDPQDGPRMASSEIDYVRVNVARFENLNALSDWLAPLRQVTSRPMALGVHNSGVHNICTSYDFVMYEGPFLTEAVTTTRDPLPEEAGPLMKVVRALFSNADFDEVANALVAAPTARQRLLTYVNSPAFELTREVESPRQAMVLMGLLSVQRWMLLLLFTGSGSGDLRQPFVEEGLLRARLMGLMAPELGLNEDQAAKAFNLGLLSVLHPMWGRPGRQVARELGLDQEQSRAFLYRSGPLGALLDSVRALRGHRGIGGSPTPDKRRLPPARVAAIEEQAALAIEDLDEAPSSAEPAQ